jgi:alkylmercury lyase-like protein
VSIDPEDLRLLVYGELAATGRLPSIDELGQRLTATPAEIERGLGHLARERHVVLDGKGRVVMAHPFATIPLGFSVMGRSTLWWGGCAWDAFALPALLPDEPEVLVATRCPGCGRALAWTVNRDGPPAGREVAHFLVPAARMWDDVVRTCGNQRVFCDERCVDRWLRDTDQQLGSVMDLTTLWRLARHWYDGRLERGYARRDPVDAKAYFREVGLAGPFWGLE